MSTATAGWLLVLDSLAEEAAWQDSVGMKKKEPPAWLISEDIYATGG